MDARDCFGESDETLELPDGDAACSSHVDAVLSQLQVTLDDAAVGGRLHPGPEGSGHSDVALQLQLAEGGLHGPLLPESVKPHDVIGDVVVVALVMDVLHHEHQVESRHNRRGELTIFVQGLSRVVVRVSRQAGGQDGGPRIQCRLDASFGERDRLLLHRFVNGALILLVHQFELVDAADAVVCQHEGSRLDDLFLVHLHVSRHRGGETRGRRGFARREDSARQELGGPLQQGTLRRGGVSEEADVDVSAKFDAFLRPLGSGTDQHEEDALLHLEATVNVRCHATRHDLEAVALALGDLEELVAIRLGKMRFVIATNVFSRIVLGPVGVALHARAEEGHLVREVSVPHASQALHATTGIVRVCSGQCPANLLLQVGRIHHRWDIRHNNEGSSDEDLVARFADLASLATNDDVDGSGHRTSRHLQLTLLESEPLPVSEAGALLVELEQGPVRSVAATRIGAELGQRVLELLIDARDDAVALVAREGTDEEFGFDVGSSDHGARDGHHATEALGPEGADPAEGARHAVEGDDVLGLVGSSGLLHLLLQLIALQLVQQLRDSCVQVVPNDHVLVLNDGHQDIRVEADLILNDLAEMRHLHV
mmetsp:Transcript_28087/g.61018  ORF Transcript_28087/g.61018 Transcript_28087/m.61018 type:complete len:598 (+) Transcript_28087:901-2694(+)